MIPKRHALSALLAGPMLSASALAGSATIDAALNEPAIEIAEEESIYDRIWGATTLYDAESGFLTELKLQGRLHLQYAAGSSNQGSYGTSDIPSGVSWGDIEVRRWRLGAKAKFFDDRIRIDGQIDVRPDVSPFYRRLFDAKLGFDIVEGVDVSIGKHRIDNFGHEFHGSSNKLLTLERTLLSNLLSGSVLTGIDLDGQTGNFIWSLAAFAGDAQREFTEFKNGAVIQAALGYDYAEAIGYDSANVRLDYQHTTERRAVRGAYDHSFSLNTAVEKDRVSFFADAMVGLSRAARGDVYGITLAPAVFIIPDRLQAILRYQYAHGENDGLILPPRYELLAPDLQNFGRGENYNAVYAGLNYFLYGHNLKIMTGVEYSNMSSGGNGDDFDGWTWSTALRLYF